MNNTSRNEITDARLILSANRALLCEVRANMRRVCVEYLKSEKKIIIYFFYNSPPSQEDLDFDVEGTILTEMSCDFPEVYELQWEEKSIVMPYPQKIPNVGICVFCRYEPTPPGRHKPIKIRDLISGFAVALLMLHQAMAYAYEQEYAYPE